MLITQREIDYRTYVKGDEDLWFRLLREAYGNLESRSLEEIRQLVRSKNFSPEFLFFAAFGKEIVGSVRIQPLPRKDYYELWDLAVSKKYQKSQVLDILLEKALNFLKVKKSQFIRGYTLSIEPYVSAYVYKGLKPTRRMFRIDWNPKEDLPHMQTREDIIVKEGSSYDPEKLANIFVKALSPFWDWWILDYGGPEELAKVMKARFFSVSNKMRWLVAELDKEPVGLTGYTSRNGNGRFFGVHVLPRYRMKQIGSTLMNNVLDKVKRSGLKSLRVYTVAFLDHLAPGAILYLKSGGRISAEYLQLV